MSGAYLELRFEDGDVVSLSLSPSGAVRLPLCGTDSHDAYLRHMAEVNDFLDRLEGVTLRVIE